MGEGHLKLLLVLALAAMKLDANEIRRDYRPEN